MNTQRNRVVNTFTSGRKKTKKTQMITPLVLCFGPYLLHEEAVTHKSTVHKHKEGVASLPLETN